MREAGSGNEQDHDEAQPERRSLTTQEVAAGALLGAVGFIAAMPLVFVIGVWVLGMGDAALDDDPPVVEDGLPHGLDGQEEFGASDAQRELVLSIHLPPSSNTQTVTFGDLDADALGLDEPQHQVSPARGPTNLQVWTKLTYSESHHVEYCFAEDVTLTVNATESVVLQSGRCLSSESPHLPAVQD